MLEQDVASRFPPIPDKLKRDGTYLITGPMANQEQTTQSKSFDDSIFDEEPVLKRYVNKIQSMKKSTNMFKSGVDTQILKLQGVCQKACRHLKITPRSRFMKQIGKRCLSLQNECLNWKELNAVISVMVEDKYTSSLNLSGNSFDGSISHYIGELLQKNSLITELDLSENKFADDLLPKLTKALCESKHLKTVNLSGNHFTDKYAKEVAKIIEQSPFIETLKLNHNEFREKGGMFIGNALAENETLKHLDLSWNHLRGKGAECLAIGLMKNEDLKSLDISWNGFGFEGCVAIGHALIHNSSLEELDISNNRIHAPALYEFLKGLLRNKGLITLKIGHNPIPAIATTPFLSCIRDNDQITVRHIDFTGVVVSPEFEDILQEIKEIRNDFTVIYDCILPIHQDKYREMYQKREDGKDVVFNVDPLKILYYTQKKLRVVDLFRKMDIDGSARLTREEIRAALRREEFNLSSSAMDAIFDYLDVDGDGEIDLMEFLDGSRRLKRHDIAEREEQERREKLDIEKSADNIDADPGGLRGRFSTSFRPQLQGGDVVERLETAT